ncbi:Uncharacterised protein [Mycobacterium tuberculosis]|nr:hypothetical protein [Mycobacterium tuberculosis]CKM41541.1 Uncharacterised protein [Mycobacterium tuberculosis]CKP40439.1 Uncharacterised protein [Mycobacterium tuberculosis]CKQ85184.1 Uncharacterised protein [Mycobacterium tuberculosis]CKX65161.1 Uncharacterised protein [Mycobacterium tuberculosis]CNL82424.1 Uncharacterised protein [Mycobacterium tuberculosis]
MGIGGVGGLGGAGSGPAMGMGGVGGLGGAGSGPAMGMGGVGGLDAAGSGEGGSPAAIGIGVGGGGGGGGGGGADTNRSDRSSDVGGGVWPLGFGRFADAGAGGNEALGSKNGCAAISSGASIPSCGRKSLS